MHLMHLISQFLLGRYMVDITFPEVWKKMGENTRIGDVWY